MGIEPTLAAWEAAVLPLNYTRAGAVYVALPRAGNARQAAVDAARADDQKRWPRVAKTVVLLPSSWPTVRLAPTFASKPNSSMRVPSSTVP